MAAERQVLSIKDLNKYIRMKLDSDVLLSDVWVRGKSPILLITAADICISR